MKFYISHIKKQSELYLLSNIFRNTSNQNWYSLETGSINTVILANRKDKEFIYSTSHSSCSDGLWPSENSNGNIVFSTICADGRIQITQRCDRFTVDAEIAAYGIDVIFHP